MEPEDQALASSTVEFDVSPVLERAFVSPTQNEVIVPLIAPASEGLYRNVLLVVPTLNEEAGLPLVLTAARRLGVATIVIDSDSTDGTCQVARDFDVPVMTVARGKGRGLREFLSRVDYTAWEYVAIVDGDATYDLIALPRLLEFGSDMVIGRRKALAGATTWVRGSGDGLFSGLVSLLTGRECPDLLSGFRLMRSSCLRKLPFESNKFELETELTIRFLRQGFTVNWVDTQYKSRLGRSKLHAVKDGWSILCAILRYCLGKP